MYFTVMKCVITEIHKKHNIWLEIVESFKVNKDTAKDIVSEMYIKVQTYIQNKKADILYNDNEINYYFIYLTLRNLVFDLKRAEKKVTYTDFNELQLEQLDIEYVEKKDNFDKLQTILNWYENSEYLEMLENETMLDNFSSDKMHIYYLRRIFKEVYIDGKKLAEFSRESKITYWSLRNTLKIIKNQIRLDYENRNDTRNDI
jgi:hypothetical protein